MVLNNIEQLLEKYENAETSIKEEQVLREYFSQDEVEPHLEPYRAMFQYFQQTKQEHYTKDVPLKTNRTRRLYQWISVAAVAVLMVGFYFQQPSEQEKQDALYAYNQTKAALELLSSNFSGGKESMNLLSVASTNINEGISGMGALNVATSNLEKGAQHMNYVSEFSKQTNKLLKN
ncbi:hypothetical protein [Winogradskyella sp. 3972H.M.0a.05]|uniref:hypothetical protein n=1 Tax=Winogradskyella sp. 3972H.M.0a.05 TaxID=2950277 RepID=UPI00339AA1E8